MRLIRQIAASYRHTALLTLAGFVVVPGCGDGHIPTYPVSGQVLVDSKPADGARIIFCPTSGSEEMMKERPFAWAETDGSFELMTFDPADGAPAGPYKVLIEWPTVVPPDARSGRPSLGPDRLRGKYYNLEKSQLEVMVEEQSNELPPFQLQSR